jgi:hypothetical protein
LAKLIDIDLRPGAHTLRSFGWIALGAFGLLALFALLGWGLFAWLPPEMRGATSAVLGCVGVLSGLFSALWPSGNRALYVVLSLVAFPIGFVLSYVIMALLFYAVITPIGLALRLVGRDPLERRLVPEAETYWVDARDERPRESYFKQF